MVHHFNEKDKEVARLAFIDYAIRHKKCKYCKWADSNILPDCRLKQKDVSTFQAIRANLCPHYTPYNPE